MNYAKSQYNRMPNKWIAGNAAVCFAPLKQPDWVNLSQGVATHARHGAIAQSNSLPLQGRGGGYSWVWFR